MRSVPSYFCLLSIVATLSLPSVCFSSLFSKLFLPSLPLFPLGSQVSGRTWHGNCAWYAGYLFSSSCVAGGVFATKPLFSKSVSSSFSRRQSQLLFYCKTAFLARTISPSDAGYSCWIPLSLPHSSGLFLPSPFLSLRFRLPSITFSSHSAHSNSNSEQIPFWMSSLNLQLFLISFHFSYSNTKKTSFLVRISVFNKFFMGTPHSSRPTE